MRPSVILTIVSFHLLVLVVLVAVLVLRWSRSSWPYLFSLFLGMLIGFIDMNSDEVQLPALLLIAFGFFLGFEQPVKAWRWGILLGIWVPVAGFVKSLVMNTQELTLFHFLPLMFALGGAYLGVWTKSAHLGTEVQDS